MFMLEPLQQPGRGVLVRASDQKDRFQDVADASVQSELTLLQRRELVSRKIHPEGSLDKAAIRIAATSAWREAVTAAGNCP
jgi:hypothetical protein